MEKERKFLVGYLPDNYEKYPKTNIEQYYIRYNPELRMRKANERYYLTIKSKGTSRRIEFEIRIFKFIYDKFREQYLDTIISKARYLMSTTNRYKIELDMYQELLNGLEIVEAEFKRNKDMNNFVVPDWFGEEVTDNLDYKNKTLSKRKGGIL